MRIFDIKVLLVYKHTITEENVIDNICGLVKSYTTCSTRHDQERLNIVPHLMEIVHNTAEIKRF